MAKHVAIILVVEEELLLRLASVDMVKAAGYEAIAAVEAIEDVAILEGRNDIRVVLTVVYMLRGIDGMRLAAISRDRWPPMRVIVVSGYLQDPGDQTPLRPSLLPNLIERRQAV